MQLKQNLYFLLYTSYLTDVISVKTPIQRLLGYLFFFMWLAWTWNEKVKLFLKCYFYVIFFSLHVVRIERVILL